MRLADSFALPRFPWDTLGEFRALAQSYPDGLVDLTIGSPVDPVSAQVVAALSAGGDAHGYPPALGGERLREAIADFMFQFRGCSVLSGRDVVLSVGSKELVASLALQLGIREGDVVGFPEVAYPTYEVGARLCRARPLLMPGSPSLWQDLPLMPRLVWINTPSNPSGRVYDVGQLRQIVSWARRNHVIVVSDECYALLAWQGAPQGSGEGTPSLLDDAVTDGDLDGLLVVHSLSKQSNLAGYRASWICGDSELIAGLGQLRKHWGLMVPGPIQAAMFSALRDVGGVRDQLEVYRRRREVLLESFQRVGLVNDSASVAGLYLWLREDANSGFGAVRDLRLDGAEIVADDLVSPAPGVRLVEKLARRGILVAPGEFYGQAGRDYVRVSLTAADCDIDAACLRLRSL